MKIKRILALVLVLVLAFTAYGCGTKAQEAPAAEGTTEEAAAPFTIGFSNMNDIYPYCIKFRDYLVEFAKEEGMEVVVVDGAGDSNLQNDQIDTFILQGCNVITAITIDMNASIPAVEAARTAGLPFISYLTDVANDGNGYEGYVYIGSENYDAGLLQGQYLAEVLPENAVVLYMTGNPNDSQYSARKQGLLDGLKDRTDITITAEVATYNTMDQGVSVMEDWLQVYDKFDCVVAQNDDSILGAIESMKAANRLEGVITVGLDGSDPALASIESGELSMSVLQDAKGQAKASVEIFKQLRDGTDPATIENAYVPFQIITADNVADFKG